MENYHGPSGSTVKGTGGKMGKHSDKKLRLVGGPFTATKVGKEDLRQLRQGRGNVYKVKLKTAKFANVLSKDGKIRKASIRTVIETPDNRHHARQNIITKGAIIDTELGKAKVLNRVGQDGVINAKLL
ncbi:MAG: 30S ribosomal protein S8e [Candidatus Micrarchaeota archaeon]|nr:30S ribosomal protein S8e [Candidatus Micrarchaeota archaeon]